MRPWEIGPFERVDEANPILEARADTVFDDPLAGPVRWEEKDVFNPAAVVHEGKVWLLYRAEDTVGKYAGTSRIGLAVSDDGMSFDRFPYPVLFPAEDSMWELEKEGGCEDPRIVKLEDGRFLLTYTAFDGRVARLAVATSTDLQSWTKHGLAFPERYRDLWSKSGAVVTKLDGDDLVAARIGGKYWMYWGESSIYAATSEDGIAWEPVEYVEMASRWVDFSTFPPTNRETFTEPRLSSVFRTRRGRYDSMIVEPGPPPLLTEDGIVMIYNAANHGEHGRLDLAHRSYRAGQMLLDPEDPTHVLERTVDPFFIPERPYELTGQIASVTFLEGLIRFKASWWLYYGTADSKVAVAKTQRT
ncbi:glycoside hydrolase family 130 protein [soil metagenome]